MKLNNFGKKYKTYTEVFKLQNKRENVKESNKVK